MDLTKLTDEQLENEFLRRIDLRDAANAEVERVRAELTRRKDVEIAALKRALDHPA